VAAAGSGRSVGEVREHFIARLNSALLRPGMYGGEMALQWFLGDLAWIDGRDSAGESVAESFESIGAWSSTGVRGAFARLFGGAARDHEAAAAFVYADLARTWGYLAPERTVTRDEYARLRVEAPTWTASADRTIPDLVGAFGQPSLWRPKYNPRYPTSVAYVSGDPSDPLVVFDFWQETDWQDRSRPSRFGSEPALRNVRWRADRFDEGFTCTPTGTTLLIAPSTRRPGSAPRAGW
jgi:hypothetical protein